MHSSFTRLEVLQSPLRRGPRDTERGGQEWPVSISGLTLPETCPRSSRACMSQVFPSATPPQGEDTINCRHRTHQEARMSSLASCFICSPGGKWPRVVLGQIGGQVPGDAGSRVHCFFLNMAAWDTSTRASPVQLLEERQWGCPRVSISPP